MTPEISIRTPDGVTEKIRLDSPVITLGRSREANLSYPEDTALSRHHLAFEKSGGTWVVRDLGSKNGTLHNDVPITGPAKLRPGDRILAGHLVIDFSSPAQPSETVVFV
ncbi:MAG: FHA domain-containing protein, partial [Acidobacteria bacterium]